MMPIIFPVLPEPEKNCGWPFNRAMNQAGTQSQEIDFISAHGTATRYNDEMEAKAIHLAALENVPVNSLKGYYGHTLGAAGILESILTMQSMKENILTAHVWFFQTRNRKASEYCEAIEAGNPAKMPENRFGFRRM